MRIVSSWPATCALGWAVCVWGSPRAVAAAPDPPLIASGVQDPQPEEGGSTEAAAKPPIWIRAKRVLVRPGEVVDNAVVSVLEGRIVEVRVDQGLAIPEGATLIDGETVCAAFFDPWSALGVASAVLDDQSSSAATRTVDGLDAFSYDHLRREALRAGVTAVRLQGGYRQPVSGLGAIVRIASGVSFADATLSDASDLGMSIGLSRENPGQFEMQPDGSWAFVQRSQAMDPFDRLDQVERVAASLDSGRSYLQEKIEHRYELEEWEKQISEKEKELEKDFKKAKKDREKEQKDAKEKAKEFKEKKYKEDKKPKAPKFDEDKEALARAADGELPLVVEVHRAAEIRYLLDVTKPFERLRLIIAGGSEAMACAKELAERDVPVIVWPSLRGTRHDDEFHGASLSLAAELDEAGVTVLFGSGGRDDAATRDLPLLVGMAIGHGFDADKAFEALTVGAARAFDLADRLGTVEPGKEAELIVADGDPLASSTRITHVISGGRVVASPEN